MRRTAKPKYTIIITITNPATNVDDTLYFYFSSLASLKAKPRSSWFFASIFRAFFPFSVHALWGVIQQCSSLGTLQWMSFSDVNGVGAIRVVWVRYGTMVEWQTVAQHMCRQNDETISTLCFSSPHREMLFVAEPSFLWIARCKTMEQY